MDVLDVFEDSLESLFGYHQTAKGDAGQLIDFVHPALPSWLPIVPSSSVVGSSSSSTSSGSRRLPYRIPTTSEAANNRLFAHHQWDAGSHLAKLLVESSTDGTGDPATPFDVRGKNIVELGAGTGLPSLVAAACTSPSTSLKGEKDTGTTGNIVITDYPDPSIVQCLKENVEGLRKLATEAKGSGGAAKRFESVHAMGLEWGREEQMEEALSLSSNPSVGFDLVLLADCLWLSSSHGVLLDTVRRLLRREGEARAIIVAGFHSGRSAVGRFFQRAAGEGEDDEVHDGDKKGSVMVDQEAMPGVLVPDPHGPHGGIWQVHTSGVTKGFRGISKAESAIAEEEAQDDSDDIHDRAHWMVVALLRWRDLIPTSAAS